MDFNVNQISLEEENAKKLQNQSITCIENLSNELIYEMLDYLNGYDIYKAFSNLNHHFQQLLHSSTLLYKLHFHETNDEKLINEYKHIITHYKHQIFSFNLFLSSRNNYFFNLFSIDSSFDHLESLYLNNINSNILTSLLSSLPSVPCLFSLTIDTEDRFNDLTDVYRLIFSLPKLKYAKCSSEDYGISKPVFLPMVNDEQFNSIEKLIIDHPCTYKELFAILSYTSELRYLKFQHTDMDDSMIGLIMPMTLSNLTYLSMNVDYMRFDEFEMFISHLDCDLKILHMTTRCGDTDYFDDDRWEEFILEYMPQLEKFYFQYYDELDHESDYRTYFNNPNRFTSSFWIEEKWVLEAEMDSFEILYSIRPYKKRWYDINSSIELSQPTRLILTHIPNNDDQMIFWMNIKDMLAVTRIYHLEIPKIEIYFTQLIDLIQSLPDLISLKINSLILSSMEEKSLKFISKKNKITKIYLEKINNIEEINFFLKHSSHLNYLQINCINYTNMESYIRNILNNNFHQYLRSLCFSIPFANDQMIENLGKIFPNYSIERIHNNIYLQWK